jgi:hypothetical protein
MTSKKKISLQVSPLLLLSLAVTGSLAQDASYRALNGSLNNALRPLSNAEATPFLARARHYVDGLSAIDAALPNPRLVSNTLFASLGAPFRFNEYRVSSITAAWGQFVAHDMIMTTAHPNASGADVVTIAVPTGDRDMDPAATGTQTLSQTRNLYDASLPASAPRQQLNKATGWLDASTVYGRTHGLARA